MFCNASTFLGSGWIPCLVIQYPAKCDIFALTLSPMSQIHERTFSQCSRCSLNVEHDITSKSSMYAWTNSKYKMSQDCYVSP